MSPGPRAAQPSGLVEVGYVAKAHGLRGEVVVVLTTDRHERVTPGSRLFGDDSVLVVESSRGLRMLRGPHGNEQARWIVRFEGYADREAAGELRGTVLKAEPLDAPDELWAHELVGSAVVLIGTGDQVGTCTAVVANPASDLLELDTGVLVPVVFVVEHRPGRIVIDPPAGLLEL